MTVGNAAMKAYVFPQIANQPLKDADYSSVSNTVSIANNGTANLYFYTAPNFCTGGGRRTTLSFTNTSGNTASMEIGDNPDGGDYNLYMNTIYTYTVTLK